MLTLQGDDLLAIGEGDDGRQSGEALAAVLRPFAVEGQPEVLPDAGRLGKLASVRMGVGGDVFKRGG